MSVIVKADLSEVKQYTGKSVTTKIGKKNHPVLFRVNVDDFTVEEGIDIAKRDANIIMLNYIASQQSHSRNLTVIVGVNPNKTIQNKDSNSILAL